MGSHKNYKYIQISLNYYKMNGFPACDIPKITNIFLYFNNKTKSNLNRKTFKYLICIDFVSPSNNCTVLHKTVIYRGV
jgi:hypothetical protein